MFGDGASNQGTFGETMNLAALWKLPVVFLVINNQYGMGTAIERHSAVTDLSKKAECLGVPGERVDGMDVLAVRECVAEHLRLAREERQPTLVESLTYRFRGHSAADPEVYRTKEEVQEWRKRDPITVYAERLKQEGLIDDATVREARPQGDRGRGRGGRVRGREPRAGAGVALRQRLRARRPDPGLVLGRRAHTRRPPRRGRARDRQGTARRTTWPRPAPPTRAPGTCSAAEARQDEDGPAPRRRSDPTQPEDDEKETYR